MRPQRRRVGSRCPRGCNHIANEPPVARRILARNHRRLRNRLMAQQHRFDLARLDAEAAQLQLRIRTAEEIEHPIRAPARQVPAAVHAASRWPKRIGHKALRREPRARQIAARKPRPRNVKLARNSRRHGLQASHPTHKSACSRSDARSAAPDTMPDNGSLMLAQTVVSVGPYALIMRRPSDQRCDHIRRTDARRQPRAVLSGTSVGELGQQRRRRSVTCVTPCSCSSCARACGSLRCS